MRVFLLCLPIASFVVACNSQAEENFDFAIALEVIGATGDPTEQIDVCCEGTSPLVILELKRPFLVETPVQVALTADPSRLRFSLIRQAATPDPDSLPPTNPWDGRLTDLLPRQRYFLVVWATDCGEFESASFTILTKNLHPFASFAFGFGGEDPPTVDGSRVIRLARTDCAQPAPPPPPGPDPRTVALQQLVADPTDGSRVLVRWVDNNNPQADRYDVIFTPNNGDQVETMQDVDATLDGGLFEYSHDPRRRLGHYAVQPYFGTTPGTASSETFETFLHPTASLPTPPQPLSTGRKETVVDITSESFGKREAAGLHVDGSPAYLTTAGGSADFYVTNLAGNATDEPFYFVSADLATTATEPAAGLVNGTDLGMSVIADLGDFGGLAPEDLVLPAPGDPAYKDRVELGKGRYYAIRSDKNTHCVVLVEQIDTATGKPVVHVRIWYQQKPGLLVFGSLAVPG